MNKILRKNKNKKLVDNCFDYQVVCFINFTTIVISPHQKNTLLRYYFKLEMCVI